MGSNTSTIELGHSVIFRRRDIEEMTTALERAGHTVSEMDYNSGSGPSDLHIVPPPYSLPHLKLDQEGFICTSVGLITRIGHDNGVDLHAFDREPLLALVRGNTWRVWRAARRRLVSWTRRSA